jgi:hypothetical protein
MKTMPVKLLFIFLMIAWGCKEKSHQHEGHDATAPDVTETSGNQELYNEVMKIHDEVMPKMNDIHTTKQNLREKLEKTPNIDAAEKQKIEAMIAKLDSANEGMMVWMRQFNPLPDSLGEERAREYLEDEMEKVKKVREDILIALEKAKATN